MIQGIGMVRTHPQEGLIHLHGIRAIMPCVIEARQIQMGLFISRRDIQRLP